MKCDNFDKIVLYIDGVLSDQDSKDLKNHMSTCEECRKTFEVLISTKELLKDEFIPDENIDIKVLNTIDKNRYVCNNKFRLLHRINTLKSRLKPIAAIFFMCCITFLFLSHGKDFKNALLSLPAHQFQDVSEPVNILVLGKDNFKSTDAIILINYEPKSAQLNLLSIPRDTRVSLKGSQTKLSRLYQEGGPDLVVDTVSDLLKVDIKYYICFDIESVKKFIDMLDGVDFDIECDMNYDDPLQGIHINLKKGKSHLSGDEVVQFLLYRMSNNPNIIESAHYDGSDFRRIEAQQSMLRELIRQKTDIKYISKIDELAHIAMEDLETDIKLDEFLSIFINIAKLNADDVNMFILPFKNGVIDGWFYVLINEKETKKITDIYFQSRYMELN